MTRKILTSQGEVMRLLNYANFVPIKISPIIQEQTNFGTYYDIGSGIFRNLSWPNIQRIKKRKQSKI